MPAVAGFERLGEKGRTNEDFAASFLKRPIVLSIILVALTFALYYPVHNHPFINYDDNDYVYQNSHVQSGLSWSTIEWAFTTSTAANWHPITWLSHATDCEMFGTNPAGHHVMNVVFHAIDVVLLFWVLLGATGFAGRSFMVAALFALHPINVESVAWVAERKTMLSMMFFLLALEAYRWYVQKPRASRYVAVAALFGLGLMSKPQIITFPCVLLLWDYWPLQRISFSFNDDQANDTKSHIAQRSAFYLIAEKLPLMLMAAVSAVITVHAQHGARSWYPHSARVGNAILAYGLYIKKAIWPDDLALLYPHPGTSLSWIKVAISAAALTAITILVIVGRRRRYLTMGWLWFLGTLVPMLGIIQVGVQSMADRYAYVSFLGLFIIVCWSVADWAHQTNFSPTILGALSLGVLLTFAIAARHQLNYWRTEEAIWRHTLQVTTNNYVAESELGAYLANHGDVFDAVNHFNRAVAIKPDDTNGNLGLAIYQLQQGDFAAALIHYKVVVSQEQTKISMLRQAYLGMAKAYRALGERAKSEDCLKKERDLR